MSFTQTVDTPVSYSIDKLYSLICKLGVNSVQNYVLTLGRELSSIVLDTERTRTVDIIDYGAEVLQYLLDKELVLKSSHQSVSSSKTVIDIIPNIPTDSLISSVSKSYPIRTVNSSRLNKDEILHSVGIASIGKSNVDLLKQQNNIPLIVRKSNLCGSKRTPKNLSNSSNKNYILETKLVDSFINEYDRTTIFMNHSFDRRGRLYTMSYPLSFQSDEYTRSCLELAYRDYVNETGLTWLEREIANLAGLDKYTHDRKHEWFKENKDSIIRIGKLGKIDKRMTICKDLVDSDGVKRSQLDKPIRFASACKAYLDTLDGKPTGYLCSIDSTASGSQIMALLTRDRLAARYTNLTSENRRYDIYSEVARKFYELSGSTNPFAYLTDRVRFKQSVMVSGYNGKVKVEEHFPSDIERKLFYEAMNQVCKGSKEMTDLINQAYLDNADKVYMSWTMPDGFNCVIPQFKAKWHRVKSKDFECMFKYEVIDKDINANKRSLAPNFIHSKP